MSRACSLASFDTDYSADSVEFCPLNGYSQYLTVGTYQLTDEQQDNVRVRKGKVYLFDLSEQQLDTPKQVIETAAILDMKWCHSLVNDRPVLGIVDSIGGFHLYGFDSNESLTKVDHLPVTEDQSILCLSLDWAGRRHADSRVATSHSNGDISILAPTETNYTIQDQWHAHDLEAWIVAFDYWNTNILYSGADDGLFKGWDTRSCTPTFTYKRHTMGITTMQSSPHQEYLLATGSYDETIYFWDTRSMRAPVNSVQTPGGGIWRLKWHPDCPNKLLSASMHAGAFVLDVDTNQYDASVSTSFLEHASMVYGADWSYKDPRLVATCSFYDHVLHLWKIQDC